jgi:hypothetical protein
MKFEIADWRFEVTWDGLLMQPIERGRAKAAVVNVAKKNVPQSGRRAAAASAQLLGLAVQTFNKQRTRKGVTK